MPFFSLFTLFFRLAGVADGIDIEDEDAEFLSRSLTYVPDVLF